MINDALFIVGALLILAGSWLIAPGMALMLAGGGLCWLAVDRANRGKNGPS